MIVKVCFGNSKNHSRIVECDHMHINDVITEKAEYTELTLHLRGDDMPHATIHVGKRSDDVAYVMSKGKTVDTLRFYQQRTGTSAGPDETEADAMLRVVKENLEVKVGGPSLLEEMSAILRKPVKKPSKADKVSEKSLKAWSKEDLLLALLHRSCSHSAPKAREYLTPHTDILVGIGPDDTATITLADSSLKVLKKRMGEDSSRNSE